MLTSLLSSVATLLPRFVIYFLYILLAILIITVTPLAPYLDLFLNFIVFILQMFYERITRENSQLFLHYTGIYLSIKVLITFMYNVIKN
jgi:hypothetical protein